MSLRSLLCGLLGCAKAPGVPPVAPVTGGPRIALVNLATVSLGVDWGQLFRGLQQYVDEVFAPVWGTPAELISVGTLPDDHWGLVFLDDADAANALGYHDLTASGLPLGKVFIRAIRDAKESVSVTASHELVEMLVDPSINLLATGVERVNDVYAYEVADAVEESPYVTVQGLQFSNFVWPAYFEDFRDSGTRFDELGVLSSPFSLAPGGYMSVMVGGRWTQVFGSVGKEERFRHEDRRGHRSELRSAKHRGISLRRSARGTAE